MTSELHRNTRPVKPELTDELLSAYIDGELSAAERTRVEQVLARSVADRENLDLMQQTVNLLQDLPRAPLPRAFTLSEAQVGIRRVERRSWWVFTFLRSATVATAMMLAVLVGGDLYLRTQVVPETPPPSFVAMNAPEDTGTAAQAAQPTAGEASETEDTPLAQDAATPADGGTQNAAEATPSASRLSTFSSAPTVPSTKQAQPDSGGGPGLGGGGSPGIGGEGGGGGFEGGGEFNPGSEPMPSFVPLETPTDTAPSPMLSMAATAPEASPAAEEPTPQATPTTEPTPTAKPTVTAEPSPTATPTATAEQVALAPGAGEASNPAQPSVAEVDGSTLGQLRQLRDRWQQSLVVAQVVLGALVLSLLATTWLVRRQSR